MREKLSSIIRYTATPITMDVLIGAIEANRERRHAHEEGRNLCAIIAELSVANLERENL